VEQLIGPLIVVLVVIGIALLLRAFVRVVTVHDYERGLRYRNGRFSGLVDPGSHVAVKPFSDIRVLDARPAFLTVEGQEVLTSDGVAVKVSLAARYVVADPVAAVTSDQDFRRAIHVELQLGLRDALAQGTVEEILAARSKVGPAVMERTASSLARLGVELLGVEVRDLMVPGELKRLFAGVVAARKEGEASLERVRGETAALRGLACSSRSADRPGTRCCCRCRTVRVAGDRPATASRRPRRRGGPELVPPTPNQARADIRASAGGRETFAVGIIVA
jgi:regulator of protease activity HflC (stomatin/prohibitin superfamily)